MVRNQHSSTTLQRGDGSCARVPEVNRRSLFSGAAGCVLAGSMLQLGGRPVQAQAGATAIAVEPIGENAAVISGAGCNVLVHRTPEGLVQVDSGAMQSVAEVTGLIGELGEGAAVELLFNTHWHVEHTGGNDPLGRAGTRIIAHENTRLWMSTEYYVDWQDVTYPPRAVDALPNDTFYSHEAQPKSVTLGGETIEYGHLREAHTDGDIYVYLRDQNILAAGGVVASGEYPVLDFATGGWIGGLIDATTQLIEMTDDETVVVPGRGPLRRRSDLNAQLTMLTAVRGPIEDMMRAGKSADEMIQSGVTAAFDADWGENSDRFVRNIYGGLWWQGRLQNSL